MHKNYQRLSLRSNIHEELKNAIEIDAIYKIIIEGDAYKIPYQQRIFKIKSDLTCSSENVIYIIECMGCEMYYSNNIDCII